MFVVRSTSMDVAHNLALEELLMEQPLGDGPVLFLWQSECAVVMGKNQNPWKECRLDRMEHDQVPLARRVSGGGTVYHDRGNLNYAVIVERDAYDESLAYELIIRALEPFGIQAERGGKSNLCVAGKKFSGNAFAFRKGYVLHHGTLLVQTDLARLNRYLGPMFERGISTSAIDSIPADVVNLSEFNGALTIDRLGDALMKSFVKSYGSVEGSAVELLWDAAFEGLQERVEHHRSCAWVYDYSPKFSLSVKEFSISVKKGVVVNVSGGGAPLLMGQRFGACVGLLQSLIDKPAC